MTFTLSPAGNLSVSAGTTHNAISRRFRYTVGLGVQLDAAQEIMRNVITAMAITVTAITVIVR